MAEMRKRTSMSVPEMGRLLGLCKTESYWLIKKNYFKTITVGGNMRVMIDSFEEWYANQFKYSVEELGQRLGLKEATAYELIAKGHFEIVEVLGKRRITKDSFERWYASQSDYRTIEDQEKDAEIVAVTYGLPEIARMLGVHRQNVYGIPICLCNGKKSLRFTLGIANEIGIRIMKISQQKSTYFQNRKMNSSKKLWRRCCFRQYG